MGDFNLDDLLADILDESKPLPTTEEPAIIAAPQPIVVPVDTSEAVSSEEVSDMIAEVNKADMAEGFGPNGEEPAEPEVANLATPETLPFSDTKDRTEYALPPATLPTFTTDEIAETLDLRNFATLVTLNTRRWHAKVKDRKASQDVADANDADVTAFETRKHLLAGADTKLKRIHKAIDSARADFYAMTLPWATQGVDDSGRRTGARMMPNTAFFDCIEKLGQRKAEMQAAVDDFVPNYPQLIEEAKKKLGKRFDITDYPNAESIAQHFDISFDFHPIPVGGDFKGLPQAQCQALADALKGKTKKMLENAMQDLWLRVHDNVGRMAERLSHPDKLFHYTLVDNVRSVAHQLKHLNVTNDPRIEELRQYIDKHLCQHDVEDLRTKPTLRAETGAHAQEVLNMMAKMAKMAKGV